MTPQFIIVLRFIAYAIIVCAALVPLIGLLELAVSSSATFYFTLMRLHWPLLGIGLFTLVLVKLVSPMSNSPRVGPPPAPAAQGLRRTGLAMILLSIVARQFVASGLTGKESIPAVIEWLSATCFFSWPWLGLTGAVLIVVAAIRSRSIQRLR